MKRSTCSLNLMAALLLTTLVSVMNKQPLSRYAAATSQDDQTTRYIPDPGSDSTLGNEGMANGFAEIGGGLSRLGSIPPRCEHKCRGCVPCDPIQIPTTAGRVGVQYANYEPEGWRCKCGTSYYNP
ncbi:uncharacterized protein LOC129321075 [Prosopis cineraria]|uniref:uncharacterized protein LOC129321075 n=1 Tax=Prosopis cineraria TaxID=364024 RepID=UPI00240F6753|nr:uncharacterized protein LOC129321075 [Prosopis cineraria]